MGRADKEYGEAKLKLWMGGLGGADGAIIQRESKEKHKGIPFSTRN